MGLGQSVGYRGAPSVSGNPYDVLDEHLNQRIWAIKQYVLFCEEIGKEAEKWWYNPMGSNPNARLTTAQKEFVQSKFDAMLNGPKWAALQKAPANSIFHTYDVVGQNDAAVLAAKTLLHKCWDGGVLKQLRDQVESFNNNWQRMKGTATKGSVLNLMAGFRNMMQAMVAWLQPGHGCHAAYMPKFTAAVNNGRIQWEQAKATALREAEAAEAAAARAEADRVAAEAEAERLAAAAAAAKAAADLEAAQELQRQQAQAETEAEVARQQQAAAEQQAAAATAEVDAMEQVEQGDKESAKEGFPWLYVAVGGAVVGAAGLLYFVTRK